MEFFSVPCSRRVWLDLAMDLFARTRPARIRSSSNWRRSQKPGELGVLSKGTCGFMLESLVVDDFDAMGSISSKRIPDSLEAAVAEVLFVDGGEVGDALLDEEERGPPIVGAAAGEVGGAGFRPESVMKVPAVGRKARGEWRFFTTQGMAEFQQGRISGRPWQFAGRGETGDSATHRRANRSSVRGAGRCPR